MIEFKVGETVRRFKGRNNGKEAGHIAVISGIEHLDTSIDDEGPWLTFTDGTEGYATSFERLPIGPVVTETVTKTRIVPGTYDRVLVGEGPHSRKVAVAITGPRLDDEIRAWSLNADQLDAAAAVLSALAKGLRDV